MIHKFSFEHFSLANSITFPSASRQEVPACAHSRTRGQEPLNVLRFYDKVVQATVLLLHTLIVEVYEADKNLKQS